MKASFKKIVRFMTAVVLSVSLFACSSPEAGETDSKDRKYTITSIDFLYSDIPPKDGKGIERINKRFNVDYKRDYGIYTEYKEKLTTRMASGEIPDVIGFESQMDRSNFFKWANQGAFLPLNDYIDEYPTLKSVPPEVWNAVTVNGKIYAIPKYFPEHYLNTPVIRKDWLDHLDLKMPTNYKELEEVAIAFTKDDPDGNGKDDTYGIVVGEHLWPHYNFGAYWDPNAWYHKNGKGQLIPGVISEQQKETIQRMRNWYKEGAINKDFVLTNPNEANTKEFYAGKAGIIVRGPVEMREANMEALQKIHPEAELAPIPPFKAPDGSQGYTAGSGYYMMNALSAELKDDPGKVKRILDIIDFGRRFYPWENRNPENEDFDWLYGREGEGYEMKNGTPTLTDPVKGRAPYHYMLDNKMWAPSNEANHFWKTYQNKAYQNLALELEKMHKETRHYSNPVHQVYSETDARKGLEITRKLFDEQAKIITGDRPVSDWNKIVKAYLDGGGQSIIDEVNQEVKEKNIGPEWK
ncbi:carbohydrate ABC transporter substrate-binding protein (CUT1 family) [Melghirimyces profundicolus]|uniref:Carbohydrate ABC transporter substrate-binding protein (CUT1 family) n=1 Tax=Melghirimyces profundicolus TaxID=1242148 RepID=A0A2T6C994_9BACL|nr:extracellular solute-binding protein [Melghirimyces profundicolus]PTX64908.1 carbohydrate ABC transporter substrate-binding protein (CUT1 family) [Melghirimyces profundicolus]